MFSNGRTRFVTSYEILQNLETFKEQAVTALGDELVSLILFGDLAHPGTFDNHRSEVNLLLVLRSISSRLLDGIIPSLTALRKKLHCSVMTMTEDDLRQSCDVFPVRFVDMQEHHRLLCGRDVLSTLTISDTHLRLRCEQELKNLMIRLRFRYLTEASKHQQLNAVMQENARNVLRLLSVALSLKSDVTPKNNDVLLLECEQHFNLSCDILRRILDGNGTVSASATRELFDQFMSLVHDAATAVDQLEPIV